MQIRGTRKWMEWFYAGLALMLGLIVLISILGQWLMVGKDAPKYMTVYADEKAGVFYAPPYILGDKYPPDLDISSIKAMSIEEAENKHYHADRECVKLGYFREETTLDFAIMVALGFYEPNPSRWNSDGSWNW